MSELIPRGEQFVSSWGSVHSLSSSLISEASTENRCKGYKTEIALKCLGLFDHSLCEYSTSPENFVGQ